MYCWQASTGSESSTPAAQPRHAACTAGGFTVVMPTQALTRPCQPLPCQQSGPAGTAVVPEPSSAAAVADTEQRLRLSRLELLWRQKVDQIVAKSLELYEAAPPVDFMPDLQDEAACHDRRVARLRQGLLRAHEELTEIEAAIERVSAWQDARETASCGLT
jgi:hypothetical protein